MRRAGRLEAGEFGEREVEILADRLVFLLLAEQFVCTIHTSTSMSITRLQHTLVLIIVIFFNLIASIYITLTPPKLAPIVICDQSNLVF